MNDRTTNAEPLAHPAAEPHLARETFDELADLFLGRPDEPATDDQRQAAAAAPIERRALIVGHLPVAASAWVAQHARDLSKQRQAPVAVISISSDHASLAVYGTASRPQPAQSLTEAIAAAHRLGVCMWLIRTDALSEIALAEHSDLTGITLLTGADEAALVKAYRALKALTSTAPGYEPVLPELHLAVLGSDEAAARPAAERLRKAAESFLDTGLTSVTLTPRIDAGAAIRLYDGHAVDQIADIIAALPAAAAPRHTEPHPDRTLLREPAVPPPPAPTVPASRTTQQPRQPAATPLRLAHDDAANASRIGPQPKEHEPRQPAEIQYPIDHTPAHTAPASGRAAPQSPPHAHSAHAATLLGLTPLEARCPYADDIELAADAEGRAHLVAQAAGGNNAIAAALESLEIARAWIEAHFTLIAAASNNAVSVTPPREPATHLIVEHAPSARRLLDGSARIYVHAQGHAESLCVPLN